MPDQLAALPDSELRELVRRAYLLQLRRSHFNRGELVAELKEILASPEEALDSLVNASLVEASPKGDEFYALTIKGRSMIRVVLAGGAYDVIHLGHLAELEEAKSLGDVLVVVVATDVTAETFKGRKPIFPEEDRRRIVEAMKPVDKAILGYEDVGIGYEQVLMEVSPDIVALGYDQDNLERTVRELINRKGLKVRIARLSKFDRERYISSSAIRQKLDELLK